MGYPLQKQALNRLLSAFVLSGLVVAIAAFWLRAGKPVSLYEVVLVFLATWLAFAAIILAVLGAWINGMVGTIIRMRERAALFAREWAGPQQLFAAAGIERRNELASIDASLTAMMDAVRDKARDLLLFRSLVDQSYDAFYVVETETGRILDVNERAVEMLGYTRDELLLLRIQDINPEVRDEEAWQGIVASMHGTGSRIWESRHRTKEGTSIPVELSVRRHSLGGRSFNIAVARDISGRKKIEQDLRIKNNAIETSINGIAISDMNGVLIYVNRAYVTMLGYDRPEEILGRPLTDFAESGKAVDLIQSSLRTAGGWIGEIAGRKKDGTLVPRLMSASIVTEPDGTPISVLGSFLDISERMETEKSLRASEERLRRAQQVAHVGSWELDLVHDKLVWSDEIFRIFELNPEQFGASYEAFLNIIHPADRYQVNRAYQDSVRDHTAYSINHRLLLADGRVKHVREIGETTYDNEGRPIKSFGTVQDITKQQLAEEQLAASLREKETLLREIHHRVKNNLQVISSLLYFQTKKMPDPAGRAALKEGQDRLRSMILVHEKLYRSRDLANIDFGDYVRTLTDQMLQSYAAIRGRVAVNVDVEQVSLPIEIALPCGMILNELVTNIFKYAFPGDRTGQATIRTRLRAGTLALIVGDTGKGIPREINTTDPETFGLQLVRNLAQQLGGTVAFDRADGTTATVEIPVNMDSRGGV